MNRLDDLVSPPRTAFVMHRATVCLLADSLEEKLAFTAWLNTWKTQMTFVSQDYGCGCCIHLFDLEGPKEAIAMLPKDLLTISAWTENGVKQTPRFSVA